MGAKLAVLNLPEDNACGCMDRAGTGWHDCLCPSTGLVQIIGRKYALPLLSLIAERSRIRFNEIRNEMDHISSSTLSIRLAELELAGLIHRQTFPEIPPRVEYSLTTAGDELRKSLVSLAKGGPRSKVKVQSQGTKSAR